MNLGNAIKSLRKRKNLKQMALADSIGISPTSLSLIESGAKQPSQETLKKICQYLKVPQPFIYFLAMEESDVPEDRKGLYRALEPGLKTDIETLFLSALEPDKEDSKFKEH